MMRWLPLLAFLAASCGSPPAPDPYCSSAPLPGDAKVKSGQGALQVAGTTSAHFLIFDSAGKPVTNHLLGTTAALDPGRYRFTVNNNAHIVTVEAGKLTRCATGTLLVSGTTQETWFVQDPSGAALQQTHLGKAMSLVPGKFRVKVNTESAAEVKPNQVTELKTGTLTVEGSGDAQYHVTDKAGASLNYQKLNKALSFFPGEYNVRLGENTRAVTIEAGQATSVKF
ncbi:MAG: hypothetical protein ACT4P3_14075 [Betaproteobacteria bacterium]